MPNCGDLSRTYCPNQHDYGDGAGGLTFQNHPHLYRVNEKTALKSLLLTPWSNYHTLFKSVSPKTQKRDTGKSELCEI